MISSQEYANSYEVNDGDHDEDRNGDASVNIQPDSARYPFMKFDK